MYSRIFLHLTLILLTIFISETNAILFLLLPVSLICLISSIKNSKNEFDSYDMFWLLFSLSFVMAPSVYFKDLFENGSFFGAGVLINYDYGSLIYPQQSLLIFFIILYIVALVNFIIVSPSNEGRINNNYYFNGNVFILLIVLYFSFFLDVYLKGGILNVLSPRHEKIQDDISIFSIFATSLVMVLTWISCIALKGTRKEYFIILLFIVLFPSIVLFNVFNSPRFFLIQAWLPTAFIIFYKIRSFKFFLFSIIFGMIFIMPLLSLTTRYGATSDISLVEISATGFIEFLDQAKVQIHLIEMVKEHGHALGLSIISVIGFFIPRALWPEKPEVIGLVVGNDLYNKGLVGTPNLSGPIFLDFYYDFGILGVVLGSILFALLFNKILKISSSINNVPIFEYIILASLPIIFRGSVGAVIPLVFFSIIYYFVFLKFFCIRMKNEK